MAIGKEGNVKWVDVSWRPLNYPFITLWTGIHAQGYGNGQQPKPSGLAFYQPAGVLARSGAWRIRCAPSPDAHCAAVGSLQVDSQLREEPNLIPRLGRAAKSQELVVYSDQAGRNDHSPATASK